MLTKLKSLLTGRKAAAPESLGEAEALLADELRTARADLEALLARRDDLLLDAMTRDELALDDVRRQVSTAERRVSELAAATAAAGARRAAVEHRRASEELRKRWGAARALVDARDEAGRRLESALDAAAAAMADIRARENEIVAALPVQPMRLPFTWGAAGLEHTIAVHLALKSPPLFARSRGLARDDELLTVAAAIAASGEEVLSADPTGQRATPAAAA
ncbi:MAG: hypothetical protein M0Z99_26840 [Betaproteobacteria bacterium]|nr:hypothetical protein [Betaproteobacteria bacterium]